MAGGIGILNVGAGDTKLVFDKNNPSECIRSGRIVTDMLRRGYALLIEIPDGNGGHSYTRVREFRADVGEYIIADFDPIEAAQVDEDNHAQSQKSEAAANSEGGEAPGQPGRGSKGKPKLKGIPASSVTGIAVARSAGG